MKKYLLNTSFHMLQSIAPKFEQWVENEYLPAAKLSGLFTDELFVKLLIEVEPGTVSYSVQMQTENLEAAMLWHDNGDAARLKDEFYRGCSGQIHFFTTNMEILK